MNKHTTHLTLNSSKDAQLFRARSSAHPARSLGIAATLLLLFVPWATGSELFVDYFMSSAPFSEQHTAATGPISLANEFEREDAAAKLSTRSDYGELTVFGDTAAVGNGNGGGSAAANTTADWRENVTINAAGRVGTQGTVTFRYRIEGFVQAEGPDETGDNQTHAAVRRYFHFKGVDTTGSSYGVYLNRTPHESGENFLNQTSTYTGTFTFGEPFLLGMKLEGSCGSYNYRGGKAKLQATAKWRGIVSITDAEGNPVKNFVVNSETGFDYSVGSPRLWVAGRDLAKNEKLDALGEGEAKNAAVPQWSYGSRGSAAATGLKLFELHEHQNGAVDPDLDGWWPDAGVLVNVGAANVTLPGTNKPVLPNQMVLSPGSNGAFAVVRWIAPASASYNIGARWVDLDSSKGNGATAHVVINGKQVLGEESERDGFNGRSWENGGRAEMPVQGFVLAQGDVVDFVLGSRGNAAGDLTTFSAVIRAAPPVTIAAPQNATEGQNVTVSVSTKVPVESIALLQDSQIIARENGPALDYVLRNVKQGVYHLQAEAVGTDGVLGSSGVILLKVKPRTTAGDGASAAPSAEDSVVTAAASTGDTFTRLASGHWSEPSLWRRGSNGAGGIPAADDVAIIGPSHEVTLTSDVTVKKLYLEGRLVGNDGTRNRNLEVTEHLGAFGTLRDLTVHIPAGGIFSNVRGFLTVDNVVVENKGSMILSSSLFGTQAVLRSSGSLALRRPPASGLRVDVKVNSADLAGQFSAVPNTGLDAKDVLVNAADAELIGSDGGSLIGSDGASLIGSDGASLIGSDGASLIGSDGASLIGSDGASLGFMKAASLIGSDGASIETAAAMGEGPMSNAAAAGSGITLTGGTVTGTGNLIGRVVNQGGTLSPGGSTGAIVVQGSYKQSANATMLLEVAGTQTKPLQLDRIAISGTATLGGNLVAKTIDGFIPQASDEFLALQYGARSGSFAQVSSNADLSFGPKGATLQISGANPPAPKALNISTRMRVGTGDNALIAGFIVSGDQPKKVLIRGLGPSLPVNGALADPTLDLDGGAVLNDDWRKEQEAAIKATGIPPSRDVEAAMVVTLNPGPHTAALRGKAGGTGVGLVEVYDLESGQPEQLANISTRGEVLTGDDVMIGGFIINGIYPAKVLLRAIGPSLPVPGALKDPTLDLVDAQGNIISNDNWRATQEAEIAAVLPPNAEKEAAIIATLVPGPYTAIVRGKDNTTGIALVEGYNLQ